MTNENFENFMKEFDSILKVKKLDKSLIENKITPLVRDYHLMLIKDKVLRYDLYEYIDNSKFREELKEVLSIFHIDPCNSDKFVRIWFDETNESIFYSVNNRKCYGTIIKNEGTPSFLISTGPLMTKEFPVMYVSGEPYIVLNLNEFHTHILGSVYSYIEYGNEDIDIGSGNVLNTY